ncbi:MAG: 4-alpha-glucanotransferase [Spirochaetes bacterium]|nr:4-alpha-glucanotransferase [Spirochaetota bacterium]
MASGKIGLRKKNTDNMKLERSSGVLLHITSLPGKYGIGTLGPEAAEFAGMLRKAGMRYWQILPVGPVAAPFGYSPYASTSTFAGNWLFISLEKLAENSWFSGKIGDSPFREGHSVPYGEVVLHKLPILESACEDFFSRAPAGEIADFERFVHDEAYWLRDFALHSAIVEHTGLHDWLDWDAELSMRRPRALKEWREKLEARVKFHSFVQYIFFWQWREFREICSEQGIGIIGDIPIYVIMEGADAWANPGILQLDEETGRPLSVAGVPPDYFSETGQRWGNPIYRWKEGNALSAETFRWWQQRIAHLNKLVDITRIDHFRGFEAYWAIPAEEETAVRGKWVKGPGMAFFKKLREATGGLPLIAEDLGVITPEMESLRDDLGLPGMRVLQFAFDFNNKNYYLPHNIDNPNCVLYTGTHDNNTTNGWFYGTEIDESTRKYILEYLGYEEWSNFHWKLIRQAYRTVANLVIIPAQDIAGYGAEFRMNRPGTADGNWLFKLKEGSITEEMLLRLRRMGEIYGRIPKEG